MGNVHVNGGFISHTKGTPTFSAAAPTTAATLLLAANASRTTALLANNGTQTVYLGVANTVTTANGVPLAPGATLTDETTTGAWWGITASGTGDVRVVEVV